jgi:TonB family protein
MKKLTFLFLLLFLSIAIFAQDDDVLLSADIMPACQSCEPLLRSADHDYCNKKTFLDFMYDNIKYPQEARDSNVQGGLLVEFVVDKNGKVQDPKIIFGLGSGCDKEVLRVLQLMNNKPQMWIAAENEGKSVAVRMSKFMFFTVPPVGSEMSSIKNQLIPKPNSIFFPNGKKGRTVTSSNEEQEVFTIVEEMPVFVGCETLTTEAEKKQCTERNLLKYVYGQIKYPELAREYGIEGLVVVRFVVQKDGSVSGLKIVKGLGSGCDMEVVRAINTFNDENGKKWQAGKQRNQAVSVQYNLPIRFKLATKEELEKN